MTLPELWQQFLLFIYSCGCCVEREPTPPMPPPTPMVRHERTEREAYPEYPYAHEAISDEELDWHTIPRAKVIKKKKKKAEYDD